jgi:CRP-like cAMP-binding protein
MNAQLRPIDRPAIQRLARLAPLDDETFAALQLAVSRAQTLAAHRELIAEGEEIREPRLLLDGWAARTRTFVDGRRQIMSFVLPGELIGLCEQEHPHASSTVVSCTPCLFCDAPSRGSSPALDSAYALSRALDEDHLLAQIARIGRLDAYDRILDLFVELMERLELSGLSEYGRFILPVTQEQIADALGLTSVHVNRMIQQARKSGQIAVQAREIRVLEVDALRVRLGRRSSNVHLSPA